MYNRSNGMCIWSQGTTTHPWQEKEIENGTSIKLKRCRSAWQSFTRACRRELAIKMCKNRIYTLAINITKIEVIKFLTIFDPGAHTHTVVWEQCNKLNRYKCIWHIIHTYISRPWCCIKHKHTTTSRCTSETEIVIYYKYKRKGTAVDCLSSQYLILIEIFPWSIRFSRSATKVC